MNSARSGELCLTVMGRADTEGSERLQKGLFCDLYSCWLTRSSGLCPAPWKLAILPKLTTEPPVLPFHSHKLPPTHSLSGTNLERHNLEDQRWTLPHLISMRLNDKLACHKPLCEGNWGPGRLLFLMTHDRRSSMNAGNLASEPKSLTLCYIIHVTHR